MKRTTWSAALVLGALLVTSGASGIDANTDEAAQAVASEGGETESTVPAQDCDPSAGLPLVDLQANATPLSSGTFYVCLSNDFLCGGPCPDGKHCATTACGSPLNPACTFDGVCVGGCRVSPSCRFIAQDC